MLAPRLRIATRVIAGISVVLLSVGTAWAADPAPADSTLQASASKEMREKMATVHEQMAACLRSDRSIAECRKEMMNSCREIVGDHGCPMMGMGGPHIMKKRPLDTPNGK